MDNFSRQQTDDIFRYFFPENGLCYFMQIVSLLEIPAYFLEKKK